MKKIPLLITFLLAGTSFLKAQHAESALIVWRADGTKDRIELSTKPQVTFTTDSMSIVSSSVTLKCLVADVIRITYDKPSGLNEEHSEYSFGMTDEELIFRGTDTAGQIHLYTLDGKQLPISLLQKAGGYTLPIGNLPKGMYLLIVNGKTYKFIKK